MKTCHLHTRHATDVHVALYNRIMICNAVLYNDTQIMICNAVLYNDTQIMICNAVLYNDTQISELKAKSFLKRNKIDISS